jgi:hypothetical protein
MGLPPEYLEGIGTLEITGYRDTSCTQVRRARGSKIKLIRVVVFYIELGYRSFFNTDEKRNTLSPDSTRAAQCFKPKPRLHH